MFNVFSASDCASRNARVKLASNSSLRGRRSKGKGEGEFEREARSWDSQFPPTTHPHDRASRSLSRFALELPFSLPLRTPATQASPTENLGYAVVSQKNRPKLSYKTNGKRNSRATIQLWMHLRGC